MHKQRDTKVMGNGVGVEQTALAPVASESAGGVGGAGRSGSICSRYLQSRLTIIVYWISSCILVLFFKGKK